MEKVWLVTGSARGLGRSIVEAVLDAGQRVVATARKPEELADLVARYGDRVRPVALDVTDEGAARAAIGVALAVFGRLDVVVNNAGYANVDSFEDLPSDDFRRQVETDFFGVVNVTRAALPVLRQQRSGHLVQISSVGGRVGTPGLSAYQASKWAVAGLTEVLAAELAPLGVKVTCVEPGGMRTDWAGSSMKVYQPQPDYVATVGAFTAHARHNQDMGRSDPKRCARALLELVAMDKPPVHLLLGSDATFMAELALTRRAAEDRAHRALSESTDYPDQPRFADTPIAQYLRDHAG